MALHLILEIHGGPEPEIGDPWRQVFDVTGGRIGRALDCEWVLSNRHISRYHARISHADGVFYIESIGVNGVAVNDPQAMMPRRTRFALQNGDRLFLDKHEIRVAIADDSRQAVPSDETRPAPLPSWDTLEPAQVDNVLEFPLYPNVDKPKSRGSPAAVPAKQVQTAGISPSPRAQDTASEVEASLAVTIPQEWEKTGLTNPMPRLGLGADRPSPPAALPGTTGFPAIAKATASDSDFDIGAFLKGAGLAPQAVPAGKASMLGQIVRTVVQGLIDVLRARAEFRSQLHLERTSTQASPNNPLRSAGRAEDALATLLRPTEVGVLSPLEALEDALNELRFHQLAMLAGMHFGFQSVTKRFDPHKLIEQCDRGHTGGLARFGAKGRYWDRYVNLFEQVAANPDGGLRRQYVEAFSEAYERQLEDLKRSRVPASD
jgi:type VI secretion system FHA domain protein